MLKKHSINSNKNQKQQSTTEISIFSVKIIAEVTHTGGSEWSMWPAVSKDVDCPRFTDEAKEMNQDKPGTANYPAAL